MGYLIVLFVILIIAVLWGISIYFVREKELDVHIWHKRALGLPRGTVRALLTLVILFLLTYCLLTGIKLPELPEWIVGILGTIIGFYFGAATTARDETPPTPKKDATSEEDATKKSE